MIVDIWVFFVLGDSLAGNEHRTAYVQQTASQTQHRRYPEMVELQCEREFHRLYPGYVVCDSGWCRQRIQVMGQ